MLPQLKTLHSRRFLLIYLAVVVMLLLLLAEQFGTETSSPVPNAVNRTFQPPLALPQLLIQTSEGVRSNIHFQQHWTYLVFTDPDCRQYCDAVFRVMDAVSTALGQDAPQIYALTLDKALCPPDDYVAVCGRINHQQRHALLQAAGMVTDSTDHVSLNNILLLNPDARLKQRYQLPLDSSQLISDFIKQRRQYALDAG